MLCQRCHHDADVWIRFGSVMIFSPIINFLFPTLASCPFSLAGFIFISGQKIWSNSATFVPPAMLRPNRVFYTFQLIPVNVSEPITLKLLFPFGFFRPFKDGGADPLAVAEADRPLLVLLFFCFFLQFLLSLWFPSSSFFLPRGNIISLKFCLEKPH